MDESGKKQSSTKLKALHPQATTNLWDGLHSGMEVLRKGQKDNRLGAIFILTDGMPNVEPPSGHIPMLRRYKDNNKMECTISSFGFGYEMDSQYYGIGNFSDYVREGLANLTLDDVNRVIRENLDLANIQYVYITKDATDLQDRLVSNRESPMTYEADKPQALLDEDAVISTIDLGFSVDDVAIVSSDEVFN